MKYQRNGNYFELEEIVKWEGPGVYCFGTLFDNDCAPCRVQYCRNEEDFTFWLREYKAEDGGDSYPFELINNTDPIRNVWEYDLPDGLVVCAL